MTTPARAVPGVVLVLGVVLAVVCVALSTPVAAQATDDAAAENVSFGTQVASFMQSTAAEANDTVESGMWRASVGDTDTPDEAISDRADRLRARLASLENQTADMASDRQGSPDLVYTARASAVRVRLSTLRQSIDETAEMARQHGVDDETLEDLGSRAGNVTGPAVASAARNLTDAGRGPPDRVTAGPDGERGPPANRSTATAGNGTQAGPGNSGSSGNPDPGPPGERGNGPSSGAGDGTGGPPGEGDGGPPENGGQGGPPDGDRDGPRADEATGESPNDASNRGQSGDAGNRGQSDDASNRGQSDDAGDGGPSAAGGTGGSQSGGGPPADGRPSTLPG